MSIDGIPWLPGFWRRIPWRTVGALVGFFVTCGMMGLVLILSEGKETNSWPTHNKYITVPVLLSLLVGVAVLFLTVANSEGLAISWWIKALKGTKLKELQYDLEVTSNLLVGVFRPSLFNLVTLSAIIALIVSVGTSAIMQRSSTTISKSIGPYPTNIDVPVLNTTLPANFSGWAGSGSQISLLMPAFASVYKEYSNRSSIVMPSSCGNSTCQLHITGPGFDVDCTDDAVNYDFGQLASAAPVHQITTFQTVINFESKQDPNSLSHMNMSMLYKASPTCSGKLTRHHCVLRAAAVDYAVTITNGTATLAPWDISQNTTISIHKFTDWMQLGWGSLGAGGFITSLGGIASALQAQYNSNATLVLSVMTSNPFLVSAFGQAASTYSTSTFDDYGNCTMTWSDPREDIINSVREIMFRSALAVANSTGEPIQFKQTNAQMTRVGIVYATNWTFFGVAVGVMFLEALITLVLIWGWEKLGREVSRDPFEIAKAMGAPLLNHGSSNTSAPQILDALGSKRVRYGELVDVGTGISQESAVPKCGYNLVESQDPDLMMEYISPQQTQMSLNRKRTLGIAVPEQVQPVQPGVHY
ncbi:hypothetical protein FP744_10001087 [Trichoderma asperellum]|nr:hypothetical protein LI328DRAFT_163928 [Trichoderma asperelloides]